MLPRWFSPFPTGSLWAACLFWLVGANGLSGQVAAQEGASVKFVSYNLHNYLLRPSDDPHAGPPKSEREITQMVKILTALKPDILGVCEMGNQADLADLQARLQAAGLDLPEREWVQGADLSRHLALLSRFPITCRNSRASLTYQLDNAVLPMQRGILDVTVQVQPEYALRLIGLHLKSQREVETADQALMRREEAHLARLHFAEVLAAAPETNLLVYGDLNETRDLPGIREIKGPVGEPLSLRELGLEDHNGARWTYFHEPSETYSHIDYLLASPALVPELRLKTSGIYSGNDWSQASDHRAIFLTLNPVDLRPKK